MTVPVLDIVAAFRQALAQLPSVPAWLESVAIPNQADRLPAIALSLGEESVRGRSQGTAANPGVHTRRSIRLILSISGATRAQAETLAWEVQNAAPYEGAGFESHWTGNARSESLGRNAAGEPAGDQVFFGVAVNFDVHFDAESAPPA